MGAAITDFFLYRYRYPLGYASLGIIFTCLLLFAGLYIPGALASSEIDSVVAGSQLDYHSLSSFAVANMPYLALQHLSLVIFGASDFSIKLPSLVLALVTSIGAVLLLRRWFRSNIAVLSTGIMMTTSQFLYVAQAGDASILYIMWPVWLLLAASMITGEARFKTVWKIIFFILAGLSSYTPLMSYLLLAIVATALLHPHVRYVLKQFRVVSIVGLLVVIGLTALPLGYLILKRPELGLQLLGIPQTWPPDLWANARIILETYFAFFIPAGGEMMVPVFGLGSIVLIVVGAWQLLGTRYTARSYTITAWFLLLVPVVILSPAFTVITFVPFLLLLAGGLDYLLRSWYRLFPRNPYARFAGLIPLIVLVSGMLATGVDRYVYGYHYSPQTVRSFSRDLTLLKKEVYNKKTDLILVVTPAEKPFYDTVARRTPHMSVALSRPSTMPAGTTLAATRTATAQVSNTAVSRIIVTSLSVDADRFYIYSK